MKIGIQIRPTRLQFYPTATVSKQGNLHATNEAKVSVTDGPTAKTVHLERMYSCCLHCRFDKYTLLQSLHQSRAASSLLYVMWNVLFAQAADKLNGLPCHVISLLTLHHSSNIAPPFSS